MSGDLLYQALLRLESAAERCELWAHESVEDGWSTHHVEPNRKLASEIREFVAMARKRRQGRADKNDSIDCWRSQKRASDDGTFVVVSNVETARGVERCTSTPPGRWWVFPPGGRLGGRTHACVDFEPTPVQARAVLLLPKRNTPGNSEPYMLSDLDKGAANGA